VTANGHSGSIIRQAYEGRVENKAERCALAREMPCQAAVVRRADAINLVIGVDVLLTIWFALARSRSNGLLTRLAS